MANVGVHHLGGEIQQPVAVAVPHIGPLRRQHGHRFELGLGRPRVKDVGAVELICPGALGACGVEVLTVGQEFGTGHIGDGSHGKYLATPDQSNAIGVAVETGSGVRVDEHAPG